MLQTLNFFRARMEQSRVWELCFLELGPDQPETGELPRYFGGGRRIGRDSRPTPPLLSDLLRS